MKILLLRSLSHGERRLFRRHKIFICPAFQIKQLKVSIPQKKFDYLLVTSAQALRFLGKVPKAKQCIVIGEATRDSIKLKEVKVLKDSHSKGVLKFFSRAKRGSLLFPRSRLGDPALVKGLRALGYGVVVRHTYQTKILKIRAKLLKILSHSSLDSIFVTSPSSFKAIRQSFSAAEIKTWKVRWVAIGPTTHQALKAFGIRAKTAHKPSLKAMLEVARSLVQ